MKIRVISFKNSSSYFGKILILVGISVIMGNFFYNNKNIGVSKKINSWKFSNIINKEITLFGNTSKDIKNTSSKSIIDKSVYTSQMIAGELQLIKIANLNGGNSLKLGTEDENENFDESIIEENNQTNENSNNETNQINSENITEPAVRTKY